MITRRQHSGTDETSANCTDCTFSWGKDTILYCMYSMARQRSGTNCINCAVSSQWISKQTNAVSRSNNSQTMLEGVYGCFMTCNVFLAGNSEVSLELQCFTAELFTYIVCECSAPELCVGRRRWFADRQGRRGLCDKVTAVLSCAAVRLWTQAGRRTPWRSKLDCIVPCILKFWPSLKFLLHLLHVSFIYS